MMTKEEINAMFGKRGCDVIYVDTDSVKLQPVECTIVWNHGETTYLKGKNALRIAKHWLYTDPDCLLVYTSNWIYLKCEEPKEITFIYDAYDEYNHKHSRCHEIKLEMNGKSVNELFDIALFKAQTECLKNNLTLLSICINNTDAIIG